MKRSIAKAITDYDRQLDATGRDPFYYSDLQQLFDITTDGGTRPLDPAALAINAMKAAYIVGLRAGKRQKPAYSVKSA